MHDDYTLAHEILTHGLWRPNYFHLEAQCLTCRLNVALTRNAITFLRVFLYVNFIFLSCKGKKRGSTLS
jgi:hypothetical protein